MYMTDQSVIYRGNMAIASQSSASRARKPPDAATPPKWRRRAEERPAEIIAAAYTVFAEKGFAAAKLEDIAKAAGVSKGALYLYFETKEDIFKAVVKDAVAPNVGAIETVALGFPGSFEELVRMLVPRVAELADRSNIGRVLKMVIGESGNFPEIARIWHDDIVAKAIGLMTSVITRGQERGEVRAGDPRFYALTIIGPLLAAVIFRETFVPAGAKPFDIPALMQQHLDTVLPGLLMQKTA